MDYKVNGNMKPEVKDCQTPSGAYTQKFDQAPLMYKERQNKRMSAAGSKLRSQAHKGRYSK